MSKYVAFLRGVNVGGRIIKMADAKACLEKAGLQNVRTILQSGNVIFESDKSDIPEIKQLIERALTGSFNYQAKVQVLSIDNLQRIINDYPFGQAGVVQHDYVIFLENGLENEIVSEDYVLADGEKVKAGAGVIYWRVDKGSTLKSNFAKQLAKTKYKDFNTNRNLNTLRKIIT